jgi:hypothetical protein
VEFEYEVGLASRHDAESVQAFLQPPLIGPKEPSSLPVAHLMSVDDGVRGVLKVSKERYEAWKAEVVAKTDQRAAADASRR